MFGLSKRERYEKRLHVMIATYLLDFPGISESSLFDLVKTIAGDHYVEIIKEGVKHEKSPSLYAFTLVGMVFRHTVIPGLSDNILDEMKIKIRNREYGFQSLEDITEADTLLFRLVYFIYIGTTQVKHFSDGLLPTMMKEIHIAIFDSEDCLDETINYFAYGGPIVKKILSESDVINRYRNL
jgi:hypothetical protein